MSRTVSIFVLHQKPASISKSQGQPRGERREPERTGERPECAHRRAHVGSERAAAAASGSAAGICVSGRNRKKKRRLGSGIAALCWRMKEYLEYIGDTKKPTPTCSIHTESESLKEEEAAEIRKNVRAA